jgi:hypothetical protein
MRMQQQHQQKQQWLQQQQQMQQADTVSQQFNSQQPAGAAVAPCPYADKPVPTKPCNLSLIRLVEPKSVRSVEVHKDVSAPVRGANPTLIGPGGKFQITANSKANNSGAPREVDMTIVTQADCSASVHPMATWADSKGGGAKAEKTQKLQFYRFPLPGDTSTCGFFAMLNAVFGKTFPYPISASTCGLPSPPGSGSVAGLGAVIEVFPGDEYSAELTLPAFLKKDIWDYSSMAPTDAKKKEEEIKDAGDKADELYESEPKLAASGESKAEFRQFIEDQKKRQIGYVEDNPPGLSVQFTQKDGSRTLSAPLDDVIYLIKCIVKAEYAFKEFNKWLESFQIGPGVTVNVEVQFLITSLKAKWGYKEYLDDRVFMAYSGSVEITIVKVGIDVNLGFRSGGLMDLLLFLKGDGSITISGEVSKESPDEPPAAKPKVSGDLTIAGGISGSAGCIATAKGEVAVTFKAETDELNILGENGILSGTIKISREELKATVTASCKLWGSTTKEVVLVEGDPNLAHFDFK